MMKVIEECSGKKAPDGHSTNFDGQLIKQKLALPNGRFIFNGPQVQRTKKSSAHSYLALTISSPSTRTEPKNERKLTKRRKKPELEAFQYLNKLVLEIIRVFYNLPLNHL
jgi:hypothetical protein